MNTRVQLYTHSHENIMQKYTLYYAFFIVLVCTSLHALENNSKAKLYQPLSLQQTAVNTLMKHCADKPAYFDQLVQAASTNHSLLTLSPQDEKEINTPAQLGALTYKGSILLPDGQREIQNVVLSSNANRILICQASDTQDNSALTLYTRRKGYPIKKRTTFEGSETCLPLYTTDEINSLTYALKNTAGPSVFTEIISPHAYYSSFVPLQYALNKQCVSFYHAKSRMMGVYFPSEKIVLLPQGSVSNPLQAVSLPVASCRRYSISNDGQWFIGCKLEEIKPKECMNYVSIFNLDQEAIQPAGETDKWLASCFIRENRVATPYISPDNKQVAFLGLWQRHALVYDLNKLFEKGSDVSHKYHLVSAWDTQIKALVWNIHTSQIITGDNKGNILVQDRDTGEPLKLIDKGPYPIVSLTIDPTEKYLATLQRNLQYDNNGYKHIKQLLSIHKLQLAHASDKTQSLIAIAYHAHKKGARGAHIDEFCKNFSFDKQAMLKRIRKQSKKERGKKETSKNAL